MRDADYIQAVVEHARKYCDHYGLDPEAPLDIYPFAKFNDVYRPFKTEWTPDPDRNQYIFVSPSSPGHEQQSLIFVKFYDRSCRHLRFCGTLGFVDNEIFFTKFHHLRKLCDIRDNIKVLLLRIHSEKCYYHIDISNSFTQEDLCMGSLVIVQEGTMTKPVQKDPQFDLKFPAYGKHRASPSIIPTSTIGDKLFQQALDNLYTDIVFVSEQEVPREPQFRLAAHKNVLATVPYFRAAFESGMKESKGNGVIQVEFKFPPNATKRGMNQFLSFVYHRDSSMFASYTIESLCELIRIADYYGFEELIEPVAAALEAKYSWLSEENVMELLRTIDALDFPRKTQLVKFAAEYIVCNFSRVGRMSGFVNLFGKEVYNSIIDAVSNTSWEKRIRNYG
jgi:hypothetical protein